MSSTLPTGGAAWAALGASAIGSVHVRDHRPLQDSVRTWIATDLAVACVADGHGHHLHFRSDIGADLATSCALACLLEAAPLMTDVAATEAALPGLAERLVSSWVAAVHAHIADNPFNVGQDVGDPLLPYGSTVTVLAVVGRVLVSLQLGDGDLVAVRAGGEAFRPLPEDPHHEGVLTSSLCQPNALAAVRHAALDVEDEGVLLAFACTDGFGTSRVDTDGWWRQTGAELAEFSRKHGLAWVAEQLPGWLEEPALVGGDDTTLALVSRTARDT